MTRPVIFLTTEHVMAIHRRMIEEFGGSLGVRDRGLLESAAMMPAARMGGHYLHKGMAAKGAAYLFHLCKNHAFLDGNKRTALASAEMFLRLNGLALAATNEELQQLTVGVADGTVAKGQVAAFFRRHVRE